MDFTFTEEHNMIRDMVKKFVDKDVRPKAASIDKKGKIPQSLLDKAANLGLFGISIPEEYGGSGFDKTGYCVMLEELGKGCASLTVLLSAHNSLSCMPILLDGTDEQKEKYLPHMSSGEHIGAFALTEPGAGSDAASIKTTATRDGDDYIINGNKIWITNGDIADTIITFAVTDSNLGAHGGVTAFIIEKNMAGLTTGKIESKMGIRGSSTAELIFDNLRVPKENMIGIYGGGFITAMKTLDIGRLSLGAAALGTSKECLELSVKHSKERVQFGHPIADQEGISFKIAEIGTKIYAMESMVYRTSAMADQGDRFSRESAIVKLFCSESLDQIVDETVQIHGGIGYMADFPVERIYRDSRINRIFEGTSEIQKIVISDDLLKKGGY